MNPCSYNNFFVHLSNPTKLKIIEALMHGPLSVTEIASKLEEEQSKISHNLTTMAHCNIVTTKQDGKMRIYSLNEKTVIPILKLVKEHTKNCKMCTK
jgi:ArsR family transcriptional regulator, lead/cadmium/zinc/bismuth-responsive transcriptional repressor